MPLLEQRPRRIDSDRRRESSPDPLAMIIIGLGSGRCGTRSLASLLNAQADTVCFHEVNPSCMAWTGTERTVLSMLEEFRAVLAGGPRQITVDLATRRRAEQLPRLRSLEVVRAIGDVAFYYLPYAPMLAEMPDVRMPVLRRDKDATVASFIQVMRIRRGRIRTVIDGVATLLRRRPYRRFRNHWVEHDGRRYRRSVEVRQMLSEVSGKDSSKTLSGNTGISTTTRPRSSRPNTRRRSGSSQSTT